MLTIQQVVTFILQNRRDGLFKDWTPREVHRYVVEVIDHNWIVTATFENKIYGMVCAESVDEDHKIISICNALMLRRLSPASTRAVLKHILKQFQHLYGFGWTFKYTRRKTGNKIKLQTASAWQKVLHNS